MLSDEYSRQEQDDALEVIAWLAAQPWCTGAVGMIGISWGGFNALQVAARRPPALKAIITLCSTDDRYADDMHYMGGAMLVAGFGWASVLVRRHVPSARSRAGGRTLAGDVAAAPGELRCSSSTGCEHQRRDAYWQHGSVCENYDDIQCPVYAVGGWADGYTNAIPRLLAGLTVPRKGLIGPWAHAYPHVARAGPADRLPAGDAALVGSLAEGQGHRHHGRADAARLDDRQTRAAPSHHETAAGPLGGGAVLAAAGREPQRLFLTDAGLRPRRDRSRRARSARRSTDGRHAGEWCPYGCGRRPGRTTSARTTRYSLVFETPPLAEPVEILGAPVVTLEVASDKPVAQLVARLCDVPPDGEVVARELWRAEPHPSRRPRSARRR